MKVLTVQEPYATFIMQRMKKIETRSWKTKYRGEIYIHAGKSKNFLKKVNNNKVLKLLESIDLNYGNIICKAELIDCVYMTKDFIDKVKKENNYEYILGEYAVGRYAWILQNVQEIDQKIQAKGKLNIWTYPESSNHVKQLSLFEK